MVQYLGPPLGQEVPLLSEWCAFNACCVAMDSNANVAAKNHPAGIPTKKYAERKGLHACIEHLRTKYIHAADILL